MVFGKQSSCVPVSYGNLGFGDSFLFYAFVTNFTSFFNFGTQMSFLIFIGTLDKSEFYVLTTTGSMVKTKLGSERLRGAKYTTKHVRIIY